MAISVKLIDNSDVVLSEMEQKIEVGLEECGMMMETFAKGKCPVDTGRLRNSITHAVGGSSVTGSYHADTARGGSQGFGTYNGTVGTRGDHSVSVGTNVEYAPYVEMGTSKMGARPFIEPSVSDHLNQFKHIILKHLKSS